MNAPGKAAYSKSGLVAVIAVAAIAATCSLGTWQLRRADGKISLQQQIDAAENAPPVAPDAAELERPAALVHRHLRFEGQWMPDRVVYLDNRPQDGRAGFYVLMALRIDRPMAADIVVNRGWVPRDANERARIAPFTTPSGAITVTGVALDDEPRLMELAAPGSRPLGAIWQNFDFGAYARASGQPAVRLIVREDAGWADGLVRAWPDRGGALQPQIDRHHGYAFQWFALAATIAALSVFRLVQATRRMRRTPLVESDA